MIPLIYLLGATFLIILTVIADAMIKNASLQVAFEGWKLLVSGATIFGLTGFGWFFLMRKVKLSTLGVWYSVGCVVLLTLLSVFYFKEKISSMEVVGIIFAVISLIILVRFA